MIPFKDTVCPGCGHPFASEQSLAASPTHRCAACRESPPSFDAARSYGPYGGALAQALHRLKYLGDEAMAVPLGRRMARAAAGLPCPEIIVPVPLHPTRLREREFNQSNLLAAEIGRILEIPSRDGILLRTRWTDPQVALDRRERAKNLRGAFAVSRPDPVSGRSVLLVDDVYTTGATARECAATLKRAGAAFVSVLTLARTISPTS